MTSSKLLAILFSDLQIDVERRFGFGGLYLGILVLDLIEIAQLIEPCEGLLPKRRIENLPFFNQDFAPDEFIVRLRVAGEINTMTVN